MVVALTAVLLVVMQATASSAYTCQFYLSTAKVTCGGVTCTAATSWWYKLLPAGFYRVAVKPGLWTLDWTGLDWTGPGFWRPFPTDLQIMMCNRPISVDSVQQISAVCDSVNFVGLS